MKIYCVILDEKNSKKLYGYQELEALCEIIPELLIIVHGTDFDTLKEPLVFEAPKGLLLLHLNDKIVEDYVDWLDNSNW